VGHGWLTHSGHKFLRRSTWYSSLTYGRIWLLMGLGFWGASPFVGWFCRDVGEWQRWRTIRRTLSYLDLPRFALTRQVKDACTTEMTEAEHVELADLLNKAKGRVICKAAESPSAE